MEKRQSQRFNSDLDAMLVSRSLNFQCSIRNFSDDGLCVHVYSEQDVFQLINGMMFNVKFDLPSGKNIDFQCKVIRAHRETATDSLHTVGLKILDHKEEYRQYMRALH